jgi:hypothetical protein
MTRRNEYRDGPPNPGQLWARTTQDASGAFGLSFGVGAAVLGFVREELIPEMIATMRNEHGEDAAQLVARAAAALPEFKETVRQRNAAANN